MKILITIAFACLIIATMGCVTTRLNDHIGCLDMIGNRMYDEQIDIDIIMAFMGDSNERGEYINVYSVENSEMTVYILMPNIYMKSEIRFENGIMVISPYYSTADARAQFDMIKDAVDNVNIQHYSVVTKRMGSRCVRES